MRRRCKIKMSRGNLDSSYNETGKRVNYLLGQGWNSQRHSKSRQFYSTRVGMISLFLCSVFSCDCFFIPSIGWIGNSNRQSKERCTFIREPWEWWRCRCIQEIQLKERCEANNYKRKRKMKKVHGSWGRYRVKWNQTIDIEVRWIRWNQFIHLLYVCVCVCMYVIKLHPSFSWPRIQCLSICSFIL